MRSFDYNCQLILSLILSLIITWWLLPSTLIGHRWKMLDYDASLPIIDHLTMLYYQIPITILLTAVFLRNYPFRKRTGGAPSAGVKTPIKPTGPSRSPGIALTVPAVTHSGETKIAETVNGASDITR
ncbi:MAG TPA: hypothetical protein V6C76_04795 [Drouetiella sp.]